MISRDERDVVQLMTGSEVSAEGDLSDFVGASVPFVLDDELPF